MNSLDQLQICHDCTASDFLLNLGPAKNRPRWGGKL